MFPARPFLSAAPNSNQAPLQKRPRPEGGVKHILDHDGLTLVKYDIDDAEYARQPLSF
jgi:hypothetical protein